MYREFFGLREKPFNVTPDPHFLYMSPSHQEAFANLLYGVRERKGFIMVTGEVGTGKTTLLHNLLGSMDENIQSVFVFHTGIDFNDLLEMIHHELGIPIASTTKASLLQSLNRHLIDQLGEGRNVALIIDEAQNLSPEILENLRLLSNLETAKDKLLQIVLVGQPELEEKMVLPQLRQLKQRIAVHGIISTLSPAEARAYVRHRLTVAGAADQGRAILSEEALGLLVHAAGGVPRQLNILCDNALLIAYADGAPQAGIAHARESIRDHGAPSPSLRRQVAAAGEAIKIPEPVKPYRPGRRFGLVALLLTLIAALVFVSFQLGLRRPRSRAVVEAASTNNTVEPTRRPLPATEPEVEAVTQAVLAAETPQAIVTPVDTSVEQPVVHVEREPEPGPETETQPSVMADDPPSGTFLPVAQVPSSTVETQEVAPAMVVEAAAVKSFPANSPQLRPYSGEPPEILLRFWRTETIRELQSILDRCPRKVYTVVPGDHFIRICNEATGRQDLMVTDLLERMNPHISDFNYIEIGWKIYLPDFEAAARQGER